MNRSNLRVIKTARTEEAINEAAVNGYWPLVKPVVRNPNIKSKYSVLQNKATGKIEVVNDYRNMSNDDAIVTAIDFTYYYPHSFPSPYAAYLIPKDINVGEHVWVEDLIEDVVGSSWNQGDTYRLQSSNAIWNGSALVVDFNQKQFNTIIG